MTRKQYLYIFSADANIVGLTTQYMSATMYFFVNIFDPWLVESADSKHVIIEGQPYTLMEHSGVHVKRFYSIQYDKYL